MVFKALGTRLSDRNITKNKLNHSLLQGKLREMNKEKSITEVTARLDTKG